MRSKATWSKPRSVVDGLTQPTRFAAEFPNAAPRCLRYSPASSALAFTRPPACLPACVAPRMPMATPTTKTDKKAPEFPIIHIYCALPELPLQSRYKDSSARGSASRARDPLIVDTNAASHQLLWRRLGVLELNTAGAPRPDCTGRECRPDFNTTRHRHAGSPVSLHYRPSRASLHST